MSDQPEVKVKEDSIFTSTSAVPEVMKTKKAVSLESLIFAIVICALFGVLGHKMGGSNLVSTMMATAFDLLINTCLFIMSIAVLAGALSGLLQEFGIISVINKVLSPLMKPLFGLPGASVIGGAATYLSDNPAILSLARDNKFKRYFKKYQMPALTNFGTAFGMGLIVSSFVIGINLGGTPLEGMGGQVFAAVLIGNLGAVLGAIVSVRLMLLQTKKIFGKDEPALSEEEMGGEALDINKREVRDGNSAARALFSFLDGGKTGVDMGLAIIPGVLFICTFVMILIKGPGAEGVYTGGAYEGVGFLPWAAEKIDFILTPLFGFQSPEVVAIPITALGAAGAAIGLIPDFIASGAAGPNELAVFVGMCMCWSGYLSTHVAMMDALGFKELTGKAILSHTAGGFMAGIFAHFIWLAYAGIFL
jgi:hypothetical protein